MSVLAETHSLSGRMQAAGLTRLGGEFARFGVIGAVNAVLEVAIFTSLLRFGAPALLAKVGSTTVTAVASYYANRRWTWRERAGAGGTGDVLQFVGISFGGLLLAEACLGVSQYLLGFHGAVADNVSANGVGLALGTLWRFWAARHWVFTGEGALRPTRRETNAPRELRPAA